MIDCAVYRDGRREESGRTTGELQQALAGLGTDDFLWIGVNHPSTDEITRIGGVLGLHPLAIEDALESHQRPKIERYRDHLVVSMRMVSYRDDDITTHEINLYLGDHYLLTVRRGGPSLAGARRRAEGMIDTLAHGPTAALYVVVDAIVDHYEEVAVELEIDVQEVETSVFSPERTSDSTRIYRLKREALEFRRAVAPLREPVARFAATAEPAEVRLYFRDISDHLGRAAEAIDTVDHLLDNALTAHLAQLSVQQNEDMRKLTAGATIFAIPTAIAGIYGMNFEHMPELDWTYGYPLSLAFMGGLCLYVYRRFKRSGWL
ncbi:MAG: magnesium/cobalt transporter CorA [Aeromicrobium sp.]|uniref:magnesium/cobalt transporter CorA n=1 Tax=Aeromicrobium sp. TaxID=1871063 RepID=UPI0039E4AD3F